MSKRTVAEVLVDELAEAGVTRLYGLVGDSLNPVSDALRRDGRIRFIHVRHEETPAFAAGAEAQLSEKLAACAGTSGPGHVHLINGLYDANRSYAPVIAIASHIPGSAIGTRYFQETHPDQLFKECSHCNELVSSPSQMPHVLRRAMQTAVSKRGVSVIALPGDVAAMPMNEEPSHGVIPPPPAPAANAHDIQLLADEINGARKVTLYCGSGCRNARKEVMALADKLKAPIGHAWRGKQWIEPDNPFDVGMTGLIGFGGAYEAMEHCDLLILLGTDMPYSAWYPKKPRIIQLDIRGEHLGGRTRIDLGTSPRPCVPCSPSWNPGMTAGILTRPLPISRNPGNTSTPTSSMFPQKAGRIPSILRRPSTPTPPTKPSSPWIPASTTSGPPATSPPRWAGTSSARSTTAPWPAPCPCPSARNCSIPNGRSSRSAATAA